jgi:hypothetical protein
MNGNGKRRYGSVYIRFVILALAIVLLAFVDMIVLEHIYKSIAAKHNISWEKFEIHVPLAGENARMLWWHVAFIPLGILLFTLIGMSGGDWGITLSGIVLFATGWEDIVYYIIQFKMVPKQLAWLDVNIFISWTRFLTRNDHVGRVELFIAAGIGGALAAVIFFFQWIWRRIQRSRGSSRNEQQDE